MEDSKSIETIDDSEISSQLDRFPVQEYMIVEAAIHWCDLSGRMEELRSSIEYGLMKSSQMGHKDVSVGSAALKEFPELSDRLGWLRVATNRLELPWISCYDRATNGQGVTLYWTRPNDRVIKCTDLKQWMLKNHPSEKPAFLFSVEERREGAQVLSNENLNSKERRSLLIIIRSLADSSRIELVSPSAVSKVKAKAETLGFQISDDTVRKHISAAMELKTEKER